MVEGGGGGPHPPELHHNAQPFARGNAGVEPRGAAVLERKALVEQHHVSHASLDCAR